MSPPAVTDEDRQRYGQLLDRAAERGLLDAYDYEVRLRDLASASTIEQMNRIVTELPVFTAGPAVAAGTGPRGSRARFAGAPGGIGRSRPSRWLLLVIVVVVVAASLVVLTIFANHVVRNHHSGLAPAAVPAQRLSVPRP